MAVHKLGYRLPRVIRVAALALLGAVTLAGQAGAADKHAVLIVDANTGQTLYQNAADALRHPASLAKMMTLYLVFEQIEQGRLSYDSKIKVSAAAAAAAPSKLELDEGAEIALHRRRQGPDNQVRKRRSGGGCRAHRRHGSQVRPPDDPEGGPTRHEGHRVQERVGPCPTTSR